MKSVLKTILFVAAVIACVYYFRNDGNDVIRRIREWAERTAEHLEMLASASEEERDVITEPVSGESSDWYSGGLSEGYNSSGGADITSHIGLSSAGENMEMQDSHARENRVRNEFQGRSESEKLQWTKEVTERYAPNAWTLLMLYDALPAYQKVESVDGMVMTAQKTVSTFAYMDGGSATELLGEMATNVHEIAHGLCRHYPFSHAREKGLKMNWDDTSLAYYLSPSTIYTVTFPTASLFPSAELVPEIPRDLRTFRFETYVNGRTSTQSEGVLGLLNEFHAYYLGSRCGYDLLDAYILAEGSVAMGLLEWIRALQSTISAYWEFDFFIREYLLHMSTRYPDDYALLVSKGEFADAYREFRKAYGDLVSKYVARITETADRLEASGEAEVTIEDVMVWIDYNGFSHKQGVTFFDDAKAILEPVINSHRYDQVEELLSGR
ncbi:MAG TPA: hypothetical protein PK172_08185 [Bacteroidales bacterium]|nr:hypothetical protein [Bacteroidales bacterium]